MSDDARQSSAPGLLSSLNLLIMTECGSDYTVADSIEWTRDMGFLDLRVERLTRELTMQFDTEKKSASGLGRVTSRQQPSAGLNNHKGDIQSWLNNRRTSNPVLD